MATAPRFTTVNGTRRMNVRDPNPWRADGMSEQNSGAWQLRREPVADPGVALAAIAQAIVQAVFASLPELHLRRDDQVATPECGARHRPRHVARLRVGEQ